ncbi:hypothetical protein SAMN04488066_12247 [Halorubrum aquaticum]|uniref:DUF8121 domain-containing protein n=1 Tax=Halorubrum aquaticum TaxID=387340 RepID=A0A1I3CGJ0_9EURY|nr:hypothetical protein [Halorubrum aquaticum]SFH73660.1 hypothetical protein SAMN04488066_12247 [Halorubrum aquaticum]
MRRRAFLASALTAASTTAAGCSAVEPRIEHADPTVQTDDDPRDDGKYLEFRGDGDDLATVGVDPRFTPLPKHFHTSISHPEGTELQSLTQRFVALGGDGTPPRVSLQGPFMGDHEPHPSVSLFREGTAAVVEVHRFGEIADETVFIDLPVTRWPESAHRCVVENTVELVEPGLTDRTHVLDGRLEFEIPTDAETGG